MPKMILVLGATGLLGEPVARQLNADGFLVRALARDVAKASQRLDGKTEIIQGDVTDIPSLKQAMQGCYGVHISVGGPFDQVSAENVSSLAPESGVKHITYISGATVAEKNRWFPMVAQKLNAEKAIIECGVPYTIFCPTWPMEQVARFARNGKPFMMGKQPLPVHFLAANDLAKMVSRAYQTKEAQNKRLYVFGPESMTMGEAINRYCQVLYPEAKEVSAMPFWLAKIIAKLTKNDMMMFAVNLMSYFNDAAETGDASEANRILGEPQTTLDGWIETLKSKGEN
jgi:uncharacterized protein YbjT (DUF2867 family)